MPAKAPYGRSCAPACPAAPQPVAPIPGISMRAVGNRGYHVNTSKNAVEIRMFKRDYTDPNQLVPCENGVQLSPLQLSELGNAASAVHAAISEGQKNGETPAVLIALGSDGLHVSLTTFGDHILVHLRYFERCYWDSNRLFPTKRGITLKTAEFEGVTAMLPEIGVAIA